MTTSPVSMKFLVLSDTHGFQFESGGAHFPLRLPVPRVDILLHCGDLTQIGGQSEFRKAIKMLSEIDAELKLVIAGNNDLELDAAFDPDEPDDHAEAMQSWKGSEAVAAGITFLEEGTHCFSLKNGACFTIYASPYQPEFGHWAFGNKHDEDRFNSADHVAEGVTSIATAPVPGSVDIMMTHGPPRGFLDTDNDARHLGCKNLLRAVQRARPLLHCFGHIHEAYGAEAITWPTSQSTSTATLPFSRSTKDQTDSPHRMPVQTSVEKPTGSATTLETEMRGSVQSTLEVAPQTSRGCAPRATLEGIPRTTLEDTTQTTSAGNPRTTLQAQDHINPAVLEDNARVSQLNIPTFPRTFALHPKTTTLMVNAALQTGPSEWNNAPWLLDLPLPRTTEKVVPHS